MFSTVWVGLHLAKGSAISIEQLAEDIRRVAHGNLDFTLHVTSHDELGLLAAFFNQMTCDLRRSKMAIELTSEELRAMEHRARSGVLHGNHTQEYCCRACESNISERRV